MLSQQTRMIDLEARVNEMQSQINTNEFTQIRLRAELAEAHEHRSTLATALATTRNEHQATLASALASVQSKPERWCMATKQVLTNAHDLIGTSTATQLLDRIQNQVTTPDITTPDITTPDITTPAPMKLTGATMYSGRGAPRCSDYRLPSNMVLKPCFHPSPDSSVLYKLPDGNVRSLHLLSSTNPPSSFVKPQTKSPARAPSGFVKPIPITSELADFLGKDHGTEMARTQVTREINSYIREHNLQDPSNGRIIIPNQALRTLLRVPQKDELTYFNLQRYMSHHFVKASATTSSSA